MRVLLFTVICAAMVVAVGCKSTSRQTADSRTVLVQSTTQPVDSGEPSQKIRVVIDDPLQGVASGADTASVMVNRKVRVQFRRDALGVTSDAPTPPLGEGLYKRPVFLDGTLTRAAADGVLLDGESGTVWIPWTSILLIEAR